MAMTTNLLPLSSGILTIYFIYSISVLEAIDMKVLSLTEPWAALIKDKKKFIETRSWQTNYRGELFIHASSTKIPKYAFEDTELMIIVGDSKMNYGYIICKCNLVDCVYMDENFYRTN